MSENEGRYLELGVDVYKRGIGHFLKVIPNLFPYAFTTVVLDPEDKNKGLILHVDGAGSKPIIAYLCYKEMEGHDWFKGLAQDVVAMNVDDIIAVGATPIVFADYIALNAIRIPRDIVLKEISSGFKEVFDKLSAIEREFRITPIFAGGETADLPDQTRTLDVVGALFARIKLNQVIDGSKITEGDVIVGLRSGGKAKYEDKENSGIMCNGLTLARHTLLKHEYYKKYPEIGEELIKRKYYGMHSVDEYIDELGMTIGEALLSPTRIYAPIIAEIITRYHDYVKGLCHNTGGGLTKILRLGSGIRYVKDNLPEPDPIFKLIQREGKVSWREMYQVFNMGIGFEIIVPRDVADDIISISEKYGVGAQVIGRVERSHGENELLIKSKYGKFLYKRMKE